MRPFRVLVLGIPAILLPLFACEDSSSSSSGGAFTPDSGSFEAGPTPEAGPIPDAAADTTAPKGVSVTVVQHTGPQANVRVLAHDASGAVIGDVKTDATGKVAFATAPSMVTVLSQVFGGPAALTYLGVADGDALLVEQPAPFSEVPVGNYSVSITPFATATDYSIAVGGDGCGASTTNPGTPTLVPLYDYCVAAQNAVLVTAMDAGTVGFGFAKAQAKPAAGATANVGPIGIAAPGTATLTATAIPAGTRQVTQFRSVANGFAFYTGDGAGALDDGGVVYPLATGFAEAYQSLAVAGRSPIDGGSGGPEIKGFFRRSAATAAPTTAVAFDFGTALPFLTGATVSGPVPARADVALTADGSLAAVDGGFVRVRWAMEGGIAAAANWSFVVPPGTTAFKLPALPADATQYLPQPGASVADMAFVEASQLPGYAQLKALPIRADGSEPLGSEPTRVLAVDGTVKMTTRGIFVAGWD